MFPVLFVLFVAVPIIEIALLIKVGGLIGVVPTLALVVGTAMLGTWILRQQGMATFSKAQAAMNRGEMPVREMADGFFLVIAALLMLTPGLMTDALGFAFLVPGIRRNLGAVAMRWIMARSVHVQFSQGGPGGSPFGTAQDESRGRGRPDGAGPIIEGEASEVDDDAKRIDRP